VRTIIQNKNGPRNSKETQISSLVDSRTYRNKENHKLVTEKMPKTRDNAEQRERNKEIYLDQKSKYAATIKR
jgi:hypothetical protein